MAQKEATVNEAIRDTPYVQIEHGLMALDTQVRAVQLFLDQSECRDKMFKVLQNALKAFIIYYKNYKHKFEGERWKDIVSRMKHLEVTTSTARRYLKLFCFVPFLRLAYRVWRFEEHGWLQACFVLRMLGLSGYMFFDNLTWCVKTKVLDLDATNIKWYQLSSVMVSVISSVIINSYMLGAIAAEIKLIFNICQNIDGKKIYGKRLTLRDRQQIESRMKMLQDKKHKLKLDLVRSGIEWTLATNFVFNLGLPEGYMTVLDCSGALLSVNLIFQRMQSQAKQEASANKARLQRTHDVDTLVRPDLKKQHQQQQQQQQDDASMQQRRKQIDRKSS